MDRKVVITLTPQQTSTWRGIERARMPSAWLLDVARANPGINASADDIRREALMVQEAEERIADFKMKLIGQYLDDSPTPSMHPYQSSFRDEGRLLLLEWEDQDCY